MNGPPYQTMEDLVKDAVSKVDTRGWVTPEAIADVFGVPRWLVWSGEMPWWVREKLAIEDASLRNRAHRAWMACRRRLSDAIYPRSERGE